MNKKSTYDRINQIIKSIDNNKDRIIRLEKKIDQIKDKEIKFQATVAILNYYQQDK